jgi:hypothetical protein
MSTHIEALTKDPDDVLDFQIDHSLWLGEDTITDSSWIAPAGITVDSDTNDDTTATVWLSGGTINTRYYVTNRIITAAGRQKDRTLEIQVRLE